MLVSFNPDINSTNFHKSLFTQWKKKKKKGSESSRKLSKASELVND